MKILLSLWTEAEPQGKREEGRERRKGHGVGILKTRQWGLASWSKSSLDEYDKPYCGIIGREVDIIIYILLYICPALVWIKPSYEYKSFVFYLETE